MPINNKVSNHKKNFNDVMNVLDFEARSTIYNFLQKNPGLHFREIARKLNIPISTLNYHLKYLEKNELLITKKDGRYLRFFISNDVDNNEKIMLNIIRQETTRNILLYIVAMACASQNEIAKELSLNPTTVQFHLKKLLKSGLIERARIENDIVYTNYDNHAILKRNPIKNEIIYTHKQSIYKFLIKYYKKKYYADYISKTILDFSENLYPEGYPKKLKTFKEYAERLEKIISEIFPHPYH